MTGSPLADLFIDWFELNGPRDVLVPNVVPLGTGSTADPASEMIPSLESASSVSFFSSLFLD